MMWLGAVVALAAAFANACALILQGAEARSSPPAAADVGLLVRLARRPRWVLGTALVAIAWPLQVLALALASITVVQPILATFQVILMAIVAIGRRAALHPTQWFAAAATIAGVGVIVAVAPHRSVDHPAAWRVAVPLVVIGLAALLAFAASRVRWRGFDAGLLLAIGAGLGYAWVDFADKLLSNEISITRWIPALIWLIAVVGFGALAFLQETSALQYRSPVVVAPVIGALQEPLPVLMAVAGGVELWTGGPARVLALGIGLLLVGGGAVTLARSPDVAEIAHGKEGFPAVVAGAGTDE